MTALRPVVFLDRDGTVIHDEHYLADPARVTLVDGAPAAIARLRAHGFAVVIVTNQSGIARGLITPGQYDAVRQRLDALLAAAGTAVDATYLCPHHPDVGGPCDCRKPGPALYRRAIADLGLNAARPAFIGDRWSDVAAAESFGGLGLLVPSADTPPTERARAGAQDMVAASLDAAADRVIGTAHRPARIGVLASGGGTNMLAIADYFAGHPAEGKVALVASNRPAAGALTRAAERGIPTAVIANPDDADALLALLRAHAIDIVALAGYLKRVPAAVTHAFHGKMLNVHPALLPDFGGPGMHGERVHIAVLAARVPVSGSTVHFVDEQYDRGPIIAQKTVPVEPDDTPATLAARVLGAEHALFPRAVAAVATGLVTLQADGHVAGSLDPNTP